MAENLLLVRRRAASVQAQSSSEVVFAAQGLRVALTLLQGGAWISPAPERADFEGELEAIGSAVTRAFDRHADGCRDACIGEPDEIEPDDDAQLWKTRSGEIDAQADHTPLVESAFDSLGGWLSPHVGNAADTVASWGTAIQSGLADAKARWS